MESWIKENPITSFLVGAVILLVLFSGFQYYQISELHASTESLEWELSNLTRPKNMEETDKKLDGLITGYNHYRSITAKKLEALDSNISSLDGHIKALSKALKLHKKNH